MAKDMAVSSIENNRQATLSLRTPLYDGHLLKTDTLCWSLPFFSHFTVTKLPIRRMPL